MSVWIDGWRVLRSRYLKLQADECESGCYERVKPKPVRNVVLCMQSARDIDCTGGVNGSVSRGALANRLSP